MGPAVSQQKSVLIVEDSQTCALTLEVAVSRIASTSVMLAGCGVEALQLLTQAGKAVRAIVTDLNLPGMDGFELIRRIRSDARYSKVPIIVVSGDTDPTSPERAFHAGANAYFAKPYSPAEVTQKLEQLLNANGMP